MIRWLSVVVALGILCVSTLRRVIAVSSDSESSRADVVLAGIAVGVVLLPIAVVGAFAMSGIDGRRGTARLLKRYPHNVVVAAGIGSEQAAALRSIASIDRPFSTPRGAAVALAPTFIEVWNARGSRVLVRVDVDSALFSVGEYTTFGRSYPALVVDMRKGGVRTVVPLTLNDVSRRIVPKLLDADELAVIVDRLRASEEL
ncbi:MAG: hypothetical protein J0I43_09785 [Microbacterium sp.]|uniref:hypothetical protein n=1 Tax=Microbacterium sp. TaxID=51671 RepID=UPI001ACEBC48|nr:hypothetical protein [Microbacterium sp.]MBN9177642.1 hypothetical protein [Microbacterium sp.]